MADDGDEEEEDNGIFHCYELALLQRLQESDGLFKYLKRKVEANSHVKGWDFHSIIPDIWAKKEHNTDSLTEEDCEEGVFRPLDFWFLAVTLQQYKDRFVTFLQQQTDVVPSPFIRHNKTLLRRYLDVHQFTELHLDNICSHIDAFPREIFLCTNVRVLSLMYNYLSRLPADVGRLAKLKRLVLTSNQLENTTVPYTIAFCKDLEELYLDNNLLDAVPGFVLNLKNLQRIRRHGNHNYFKATFMWYHTDVDDRILWQPGERLFSTSKTYHPASLQFLGAQALVASRIDFFSTPALPVALKEYVADMYFRFNVCGRCRTARLRTQPGYKVFTFKNAFLGNTCVPFQHWACSLECAEAIELPAHIEQTLAAEQQDRDYEQYVLKCQLEDVTCPKPKKKKRRMLCVLL